MTRISPLILSLLLFFGAVLSGCQTIPVQSRPLLEDEGEVLVYMQPFSQEAMQLRFSLGALSAVREDGADIPLAPALADFSGREMNRQRLIAVGRLPAGRYTGFLLSVKNAVLTTEDKTEIKLLAPEAPQKLQFPFTVERKKAMVIAWSFRYEDSLYDKTTFNPRFAVTSPIKPLDDLTGYLSGADENIVLVFDKFRQQVTGAIATGAGPRAIVMDPASKKAYVTLSGDDAVEVIDMKTGALFNRITLFRGDDPQELALTPDGKHLFVVNAGSDSLSMIDTTSLVERARISVGRKPRSLLVDPTGRRVFVFNRFSNSISVVDISYKTVIATIATGPEPLMGQFNRTGDRLYVIHGLYAYLYVIDPTSFSVVQKQFLGAGAASMKIDAKTDLLYLCKKNETAITVYNLFTFTPVGFIPSRGTVEYMAIDNVSNYLYAVVPERNNLMIFNLINGKIAAELDTDLHPSWVALMGER